MNQFSNPGVIPSRPVAGVLAEGADGGVQAPGVSVLMKSCVIQPACVLTDAEHINLPFLGAALARPASALSWVHKVCQ